MHLPPDLKPPVVSAWFAPITGRGGRNLFCSNHAEWKHNNALFLPFFNNSNLDATIPVVVQQLRLYRDILRAKASDAPVRDIGTLARQAHGTVSSARERPSRRANRCHTCTY